MLLCIYAGIGAELVENYRTKRGPRQRVVAHLGDMDESGRLFLRAATYNITDWTAEELWKAYIQLTEAEAAFRITKSDLSIRPIWHQREERVQAHVLVCFLAYVVWKTLGQMCQRAGLGHEPRKVFPEDRGADTDGGRCAAHKKRCQHPPPLCGAADQTPGYIAPKARIETANVSGNPRADKSSFPIDRDALLTQSTYSHLPDIIHTSVRDRICPSHILATGLISP